MPPATFIKTRQYQRFEEFCDACREYRYIGICHGPPGVGKTLSARQYTHWDEVDSYRSDFCNGRAVPDTVMHTESIFFTTPVVNSPGQIDRNLKGLREQIRALSSAMKPIESEAEVLLAKANTRERQERAYYDENRDWLPSFEKMPRTGKTVSEILTEKYTRESQVPDPTRLIIIDEADRLKISSFEQVRNIFDRSDIGIVLIGMPGLEKRLARYPQLYSRVGFVHEFRPLDQTETRELLRKLLGGDDEGRMDEESVAAIIRNTGGNFRLIQRLLAQITRILEINELEKVTSAVVETARENLVIGTE